MSLATRLTVCGLQRKPLTTSVVGGGEEGGERVR